jgi:hypoxia up-regulated 1
MRFVFLLLCSRAAAGAVIGIDMGARFLKVGIIQPGTGIELVLNEATKRKSSSTAGFNSQDERVYGDESQNLLGKAPQKQFMLSKLLLGKRVSSAEVQSFVDQLYPYEFVDAADTGAAILKYGNGTYRGEELVAFVLSYAKQIADNHAGAKVKDCVITIPPFFAHAERQAMINAAAIAGLNVLALVHENTAFAFKYGFDKEKEFADQPLNVVFYDLGATSYKVSLVNFFSTVGKKNKTTGGLTVKGVAWDSMLGGRDFDHVVLDILADEFNKQGKNGYDVRAYPRAVGKLRKEAERVKDVLSANTAYQVGIESVHEDRDLRMVIKREDFEARAEAKGLWARLAPPLDEVLRQANLTKEEVHRVEIVGGATRIPRVKELAKSYFGRTDGSLNGDEAAALGATLYAAKLSTSFRLREFAITDAFPHAINVRLGKDSDAVDAEGDGSADGDDGVKKKDKALFKANTKFPHKKLITMSRTEDLQVALSYADDASPIATFNISGVASALGRLEKDEKRTAIGKPKVAITFALTASGLLDVAKSELSLEMKEIYDDWELVPANETVDAANATDTNASADELGVEETAPEAAAEAAAGTGSEGLEGSDNATSDSNGTNASGNETNASSVKMVRIKVERERKRVHYSTLKADVAVSGGVGALNGTQVRAAITRNVALLEAEEKRRVNAEAKNALESFIIDTRDKLGSEEGIEQVSTEEVREVLRADFEKMEDWLYEEGRDLSSKEYNSKKKELEAQVAPIFLRLAEMEARPRVVSQSNDAINWTLTLMETWVSERPEVTAEERAKVGEMCANFTAWLGEMESKQAALPLHDEPAFLSAQVTARLEPIEKEVRRLIKKPKPKPPKVKANATATDVPANASTDANASSADGADGAEPGGGEPEPTIDAETAKAEPADTEDPPKEEL